MQFISNLDYFRSQSRTGRIVFKRQTDPDSKIDEKGNKVLKQKMFFEQIRPGISVWRQTFFRG